MLPICMVNAETLAQLPEDVRLYLRALRRRVLELEQTDPQQRIAELEAANRGLQVELDDALALDRPASATNRPAPTTARGHQGQAEQQFQQLLPAAIVGPLPHQAATATACQPTTQEARRPGRAPPPLAPAGARRTGRANHPLQTDDLSPLWPAPDGL